MTDFYKDFSTVGKDEWLEKVKKDLKGKTVEEKLHYNHPIEEIEYRAYGLADDQTKYKSLGQDDNIRGGKINNNDWINNINIPVSTPKEMNTFALHQLMNGATGITLDISSFEVADIETNIKDIQFEHIVSTFYYATESQHNWLKKFVANQKVNATAVNKGNEELGRIENLRNHLVKAIDVQYAGGNIHQEIAYALHQGHEILFQLLSDGLSIDDAAAQIKFRFGIGSNFLFEIAKFKAFRSLWFTLVDAYNPEHSCSTIPYIEASTGFLNKSLKDPHNNLLRQTTEGLSAILGGIEELTIQAYNSWSTDRNIDKTQRLGLNIALLLKEESYLDKVIDPAGGAYVQEELLENIKTKAWKSFQRLEKEGIDFLNSEIKKIANRRIELTEDKKVTLIGVNKYFNEEPSDNSWKIEYTTPFGNPLVLEKDCKIENEL